MQLRAIRTTAVDEIPEELDLLICACGYESRATNVARQIMTRAKRRVALGFTNLQELHYAANRDWFKRSNFEVIDVGDSEFQVCVRQLLHPLTSLNHEPRVAIDVSCLNRSRMAWVVTELMELSISAADVFFIYCLAEYSPPASDLGAISIVEPVTPEFAGWTLNPDRPPAAVLGLGYEESRAIGIIDHLEINNAAWAFVPVGPIPEYLSSVDGANRSLYAMIGSEGRRMQYEVMDPAALFRELNSLVDLLKARYNPIIIPFGPKIFALVSLLVATVQQEAGVWRVSSGMHDKAIDRVPSLYVTALRARFGTT